MRVRAAYIRVEDSTYIFGGVRGAGLANILKIPTLALLFLSCNDFVSAPFFRDRILGSIQDIGRVDERAVAVVWLRRIVGSGVTKLVACVECLLKFAISRTG